MDLVETRCIFCATTSDRVVIEENGYQGRRCGHCGLIYISPRPSADQIAQLYGHDDAFLSASAHIAAEYEKRLAARHHLRIVRSFVPGGAILEIGAGAGYFLDEARKVGFEPYGIELNPAQAEFMRSELRIPCEQSPLESTPFDGRRFDAVFHSDVLSHLFDPMADFRRIHALMKSDAYLIFETGNLADVHPKYYRYIDRFQYPDHLYFFGAETLTELLRRTGFELVKLYRYSILPQLAALRAYSEVKGKLRGSVSTGNSVTETSVGAPSRSGRVRRWIDHVLRYEVGRMAPKGDRPQTLIVVARKARL